MSPADNEEELHEMVGAIDVSRRWYQGNHYDIALSKRSIAIAVGAIEITWKHCGAMNMRRRITGQLGAPAEALDWAAQHFRTKSADNKPFATSPAEH